MNMFGQKRQKIVVTSLFIFVGFMGVFAYQTDIDSLLQGKEFLLPQPDSSVFKKGPLTEESTPKTQKSTHLYVLQFEALADFDAAQGRRAELQRKTGYNIQLVFDSPFYKLRAGGWTDQAEAEDRARALEEYNVKAFVIKVK